MADKKDYTFAKTEDGSIQMTFTLLWSEVLDARKKAATTLGADVTVPGFRKGAAPEDLVMKHLSPEKLTQEVIGILLPARISAAYKEHKVIPAMYPKVELLHAHNEEPWEVRVTVAELPEVKLGEYKKVVKEALNEKKIWTPKDGEEAPKEMTREEKENRALKALTDSINITLPVVLVEEESNHRLSHMLARLEKLGLSLENYLSSQGKDIETIRAEYAQAASESIKLELILGKIVDTEKITVTDEEVGVFGNALMADPKRTNKTLTEEEKSSLRTILLKRKAIETLVS